LETSTRAKLEIGVWVLSTDIKQTDEVLEKETKEDVFRKFLADHTNSSVDKRPLNDRGLLPTLAAWTKPPTQPKDEYCDSRGTGGYTGLENQLFRVEIHQGSTSLWDGVRTDNGNIVTTGGYPRIDPANAPMTFKYSIDNGSIVYRVKELSAGTLTLASAWRDESRAIKPGSWMEILKESADAGILVYVRDVQKTNDGVKIKFTLQPDNPPASAATYNPAWPDATKGDVIVRRWDHYARKDFPQYQGGIVVPGVLNGDVWTSKEIPLQDGIWIRFTLRANLPNSPNPEFRPEFRPGDYWLIPARAALQDILWPKDTTKPGSDNYVPVPARYIRHYYAPIAIVEGQSQLYDLRRMITPTAGI
jgi:hypothetical protein